MSTSVDLEQAISEYAILLEQELEAKRVLRSIQTKRGTKRRRVKKLAELSLVSTADLAVMVAEAQERPAAPVAEADEKLPTEPICPDCDGTGYDFFRKKSDGRSPQCSTCMGGGFLEDD